MNLHPRISVKQSEQIVYTGCVFTGSGNGVIRCSPLGSCIAVLAYDASTKIGGLAHIMLPGKSDIGQKENKYAENAFENLIYALKKKGAKIRDTEICIVGGANVLRKEKDTIAEKLFQNVIAIAKKKNLTVKKIAIGGYERRTASLNLNVGTVNFTIGDSQEKELHQFQVSK